MPSSKPRLQPSPREPGTGCPRTPRDGKVVCFFQSADKFKARHATFGFNDAANLDEGSMANLLRAEEADRRRRGEDPRARAEGRELTTER